MIKHWADTSAVLHWNAAEAQVAISPLTLSELEHIKTNDHASQELKYNAREAIRRIISGACYSVITSNNHKIDKMLKKYNFLSDINDHRIICAAELYAEENEENVIFMTCDAAQYTFALQMPRLMAVYTANEKPKEDEWCGWAKYYPDDNDMNILYTDPQMNVLKCKTNEFAKIYRGSELKDVLFWDGTSYRPLKYKDIKSDFLGKNVHPLNLEQKMAFDLLQNSSIPVKLLYGVPGSGKDYLMFLHAWDLIQKGKKDKIIFIRNLVPFKDAPEIGFLQGSLQEKISWGLGPIESILGEEGLTLAQQAGQIEAVNLGFIRGCSWDNTILYVSEGQNITGGGYKLLISRCGENSELWINGDILQTDDKKFETNNGLERITKSLAGNKLFGSVKLLKTERSAVAELAASII